MTKKHRQVSGFPDEAAHWVPPVHHQRLESPHSSLEPTFVLPSLCFGGSHLVALVWACLCSQNLYVEVLIPFPKNEILKRESI